VTSTSLFDWLTRLRPASRKKLDDSHWKLWGTHSGELHCIVVPFELVVVEQGFRSPRALLLESQSEPASKIIATLLKHLADESTNALTLSRDATLKLAEVAQALYPDSKA
jgi:hypothetical protein